MKPSAYDKDLANRSKLERGYASFKAWAKDNRKHAKQWEAVSKSKRDKATKQKAKILAEALNYEYEKLIAPNL